MMSLPVTILRMVEGARSASYGVATTLGEDGGNPVQKAAILDRPIKSGDDTVLANNRATLRY